MQATRELETESLTPGPDQARGAVVAAGPEPSAEARVSLHEVAQRVAYACLLVELALVVLDLVFAYGRVVPLQAVQRLFNMTREDGINTWFASTQTLAVGGVLALIGLHARWADRRRLEQFGWALLSALFVYIAVDDALGLHERLGSAFGRSVARPDGEASTGLLAAFPTYYWQLLFAPVFGGAALFMLLFLWRKLEAPGLRLYFGLGLGCLGVAVGLDFFEGVDGAHEVVAGLLAVRPYTVSHIQKVVEEFLELFGTTAFLFTFLALLASRAEGMRLLLASRHDAPRAPAG